MIELATRIVCTRCHRPMKAATASGLGPKCEKLMLAATAPKQAELFPSWWQRMKVRCVEVFAAMREPSIHL